MFETSEDELRKTMDKTNKVIESILKIKPCLASEHKIENLFNIYTGITLYHYMIGFWFDQCAILVYQLILIFLHYCPLKCRWFDFL